ncbi:MAG: class II fructose-bisphosphate aldolase [Elusimicrobia bacterium]|nr:class II fructose-bisphosphate aldolase [Elusimicrobiota bacterium]
MGAWEIEDGSRKLRVLNGPEFQKELDLIVWKSVFGPEEQRLFWRRLIIEAARQRGAAPASIAGLYQARGRGEVSGFTVPAINIRGLTYEAAQAVFRAAQKLSAGAFVFELARSEIGYTAQRPSEYAACILAAALRVGWKGPVFIQGDHYQVSPKKYKENSGEEVGAIKRLIDESLDWDYGQIDIDASTIVDLARTGVLDQQKDNASITAELAGYARRHPCGGDVSLGGEIGEVGKTNSTPEELRAFMKLCLKNCGQKNELAKVSVNTGTSHGGVVLPDGGLAKVAISFETLAALSRVAKEEFGLAGAVQHGASTLPEEMFDQFPKAETAEIHLATGFQNIMYDLIGEDFRREFYARIEKEFAPERNPADSPSQFIYKTRKKGFGMMKKEWWSLDSAAKKKIVDAFEEKAALIFKKLKIANTLEMVKRHVRADSTAKPMPSGGAKVPG